MLPRTGTDLGLGSGGHRVGIPGLPNRMAPFGGVLSAQRVDGAGVAAGRADGQPHWSAPCGIGQGFRILGAIMRLPHQM